MKSKDKLAGTLNNPIPDSDKRKRLDQQFPAKPAARVRYASDQYGAKLQSEIEQTLAQRSKVGSKHARSAVARVMSGQTSRSPFWYGKK